jgi:exosome complex component RRP42
VRKQDEEIFQRQQEKESTPKRRADTMASSQHVLLSPAELAYLHASLSLTPPIRPDGRSPTQFRPLVAETGILPGTNGSARICFADGTEAIVGVKAEVERTAQRPGDETVFNEGNVDEDETEEVGEDKRQGEASWVELTVEIPGLRDDDSGTAFLAAMLSEALLVDGEFVRRLWINRRFHWKLYLDVRSSDLHAHPQGANPANSPRSSSSLRHYPTPSRCSPSQPTSRSSRPAFRASSPRATRTPSSTTTGRPRPTSSRAPQPPPA